MKQSLLFTRLLFSGSGLLTLVLFLSACNSNEPDLDLTISTAEPTNITLNSATLGGTIESAQPELISARGVVWGRNPAPELFKLSDNTKNGSGAGSFTSELTNLNFSLYYVRAYAKMEDQVFYGNEVILDLNSIIPSLAIVKIGSGSSDAVQVETSITYTHTAPIIEKGICWSTASNPTVNLATKVVNTGSSLTFSEVITVLPWNAYYVRGYAITDVGVFYSNNIQIINTPPVNLGEVTDIDGNKYKTTTIGDQVWMAENLKVTRYNDGTSIATGSEAEFKISTNGMYTVYEGDGGNLNKFGYLYNGYTVLNSNKVCMTGWRVPTPADWGDLASSLGGLETAGGRMKAISDLWANPNTAADNASGFSALPGGSYCRVCISNGGTFADKGADGYFWSSTTSDFYYVTNNVATLRTKSTGNINDGMAIRCVKN
jgi:uncharacterized protein (TIGR02145 family)